MLFCSVNRQTNERPTSWYHCSTVSSMYGQYIHKQLHTGGTVSQHKQHFTTTLNMAPSKQKSEGQLDKSRGHSWQGQRQPRHWYFNIYCKVRIEGSVSWQNRSGNETRSIIRYHTPLKKAVTDLCLKKLQTNSKLSITSANYLCVMVFESLTNWFHFFATFSCSFL